MTTLLLLPGMDGTGCLFEPLVKALGADAKVQTVQYPDDPKLGYPELTRLVQSSLPTEPFVVLGESFSGPIAIALASKRLEYLRGLILCCTFARSPRPAIVWLRPLIGMLATIPAPVGLLARFLFGRFRTTELQALFDRALSQVSASTLAERLRAVMSVDVSAELERVSVPVLYLKAASDQLVPASAAAYIRTLKPEAREVEIEGSHFLLQVSPKKAALAVRSFVAAVSLHRGPAPLVE